MKRVEVMETLWKQFRPSNRFDLKFEHRYIHVAEILPTLEKDYSRITILEARKQLGIRAGHIAGRHVWWAPRVSLDRVITPDSKIQDRRKQKRMKQTERLLPTFKSFMKDMRFAVLDSDLFTELKTYMRPHSFTYAALSGVKKELGLVLYPYEGKKYRIWPSGTISVDMGGEIGQETIGNWIEECFEEQGRQLHEKQIVSEDIHPAVVQYVLRAEFISLGKGMWRSKSL